MWKHHESNTCTNWLVLMLSLLLCCSCVFLTSCGSSYSDDYDDYDEEYEEDYDDEIDIGDIDMFYVDSTCFSAVGYDYSHEILLVEFLSNPDACYAYYDLPNSVYNEFINSDSLGGYYNDYIKGWYECEKFEY